MRTVQVHVNGVVEATYSTIHRALSVWRAAPQGGSIVSDGSVLARSFGARWELDYTGIQALAEEFYSPLYEKERNS